MVYSERLIKFIVKGDLPYDLKKRGFEIRPGESLQIEGEQAQDAFSAVADKPTQVQVIELFKKDK